MYGYHLNQLWRVAFHEIVHLKTHWRFFIISGTLQVHLPRHRRLRRPVQEQGRGVRLLRAGQFHQQQNSERLAEKIIEKKVRTSSKTFFFFSTRRCSGKTPFCYILDFSTILYLLFFVCQ